MSDTIERTRYHIILIKQGGNTGDHEELLARMWDIMVARIAFHAYVQRYPGRFLLLVDGGMILARNDEPYTVITGEPDAQAAIESQLTESERRRPPPSAFPKPIFQ